MDDNEDSIEIFKPNPIILISGQEISNNLLVSIDLQFGDELWSIVLEKTVNKLQIWEIDAQNIDTFIIKPPILLYEMVKRSILKLLFTIIMDECYQESIYQTQINCTNIDVIASLRADIVKPLLKSFMANETKCVQTEFFVDDFERVVQINDDSDENVSKYRLDSSNIINFEVNLCH